MAVMEALPILSAAEAEEIGSETREEAEEMALERASYIQTSFIVLKSYMFTMLKSVEFFIVPYISHEGSGNGLWIGNQ